MIKVLRLLSKTAFRLFLLAALLLGCRFVCLRLEWPDWTMWAMAAAGVGAFLGAALLHDHALRALAKRRSGLDGGDEPHTPETAARMRATWHQGKAFLAGAARDLPWYISLGSDDRRRKRIVGLAAVPGTETAPAHGEFTWHFAQKAVWLDLDFGMRRDDGGRWKLFLTELGARQGSAGVRGVVAALDARELLADDDLVLKEKAGLLRSRLDTLMRAAGHRVSVHLLVNRIDQLYGMRSVASSMDRDQLARPLGAFATDAANPDATVAAAFRSAIARLSSASRQPGFRPAPPPAAGTVRNAGGAASVQAPQELARLAKPLHIFCREAFNDNPYQKTPHLAGLFFGSTGPKGDTVAPLLSELPAFRPEREPVAPARPWFWTGLVQHGIPGAGAARNNDLPSSFHRPAWAAHSGFIGLLMGTLVLCWLMTAAFLDARRTLELARGRAAEPTAATELERYLDLCDATGGRNRAWPLPRFGMNQPLELERELRRRYSESFRDLKIIPAVHRLEDRALSAASARDAAQIGDTLLELAATHLDMSRCVSGDSDAAGEFLRALQKAIHPERAGEIAMTQAYFGGAENEEWMPALRKNLEMLQKHVLDQAMGGDIMAWLPRWVEGVPGLAAIDTASAWAPAPVPAEGRERRRVGAAWTRQGYLLAEALLDALSHDGGERWATRRSEALDSYRREAATAWRQAADELWNGFQNALRDEDVPALLHLAGAGDHPASRFSRLAREHLSPMFGPDANDTATAWSHLPRESATGADDAQKNVGATAVVDALLAKLAGVTATPGPGGGLADLSRELGLGRERKEYGGSDAASRLRLAFREVAALSEAGERNLEAIRDQYRRSGQNNDLYASVPPAGVRGAHAVSDPFARAWTEAGELEYRLHSAPGAAPWKSVSPLAVYDYVRYLSTRNAAVELDRIWQDRVYRPSRFLAGTEEQKLERVIGPGGLLESFLAASVGLWDFRDNRLDNATWDRLSFMFNCEFLDYCNWALARSGETFSATVPLTFRVEAVGVDTGARERPQSLDIIWRENGGEQTLHFRNYQTATEFVWRRDRNASVMVRINFPSLTLTKEFTGPEALADFVRGFADGVRLFGADDFPGHRDSLRRLGVSRIAIKADVPQAGEFLRQYTATVPELPRSIITPGAGGGEVRRGSAGIFGGASGGGW